MPPSPHYPHEWHLGTLLEGLVHPGRFSRSDSSPSAHRRRRRQPSRRHGPASSGLASMDLAFLPYILTDDQLSYDALWELADVLGCVKSKAADPKDLASIPIVPYEMCPSSTASSPDKEDQKR